MSNKKAGLAKDEANGIIVVAAVAADPPANTVEYEAIPKLLFDDMQQEDEEKVAAAVAKLDDLLTTSNVNWKVNADQALSLGAIAIILLLMRKWHYNRSIQFHGCDVLAWLTCSNGNEANPQQQNHLNLSTNDDGNPVAFYTLWPSEAVSIRHHLVCCGLRAQNRAGMCLDAGYWQCSSCRLQQTSSDAAVRATAAAVSIIKSGGMETTMAAMKLFPDDDDIQGKGCTAIGNAFYLCHTKVWSPSKIVDYANPTIDKAMARFAHELNGIELVVRVMETFQNNASVQDQGCHVLQQLSNKQVLRGALKRGGTLSAVGEAAENHDGDSLQSKAAAFFKNMFEIN